MAYSIPNELKLLLAEKELVQLASDGRIGRWDDAAVQAVLAEAIDQADSEIDGYVGVVVTLPLPKTPAIIGNLSAKIAVYNLLRRRPSVPDHWHSEYERCLRMLEKIADGKLKISGNNDDSATNNDDQLPGMAAVVTREKNWG